MTTVDPTSDQRLRTVLAPFVDAGVFDVAEVQFVETVARLHHEPVSPDEALALAVALRAPRHGHVGVELAEIARRFVPDAAVAVELPWPDPDRWADVLRNSGLVHDPADTDSDILLPLVLDGGRIYLHRYHRHETDVADLLRRRADRGPRGAAEPDPERTALLDVLLPPPADGGEDRQRIAVERALRHPVTVVAGGPGTGKTHTIARLLAAVLADPDGGVETVALAAPTGKAAARMTEAVHAAVAHLPTGVVPDEVRDRLGRTEATTIHSLIGLRPGGRVLRDRHRPIVADLVVVDETSMVDLPLLARLLDATPPDGRLVFVGDPDQLASVGAGTVLADMVGPARSGVSRPGPLEGRITVLDRVHRFGAESGIAALADAIRIGDVERTLGLLDGHRDDLRLVPPEGAEVAALRDEIVEAGVGSVAAARDGRAVDALTASERVKVLTAVHRGPNGRFDWSDRIERGVLGRFADDDRHGVWYPGRPVLVGRNDPLNRVFNGDTGVTVRHDGHLAVAMADGRGDGPRLLRPARLAEVDTWWAMTIHKSQGSEFPHVVVALPTHAGSPVLTRELLYTAVTRARERVTIVATPEILAATVARPVARASGLEARLVD